MRELCFYGASDDLFEIEGTEGDEPDEVGCYGAKHVIARIFSPTEGGVHVVGCYAPGKKCDAACWSMGLMQLMEGTEIPNWNYRYEAEGYTVRLYMDVPDDAVVSMVDR